MSASTTEIDNDLRSGLDREYPDWRNPTETHMVPSSFPYRPDGDKGAGAEKVFYNLIDQFGAANKEPMFVVHSYPYSDYIPGYVDKKKRSWVIGEADFVIIHRKHGVMFFEVKATETGATHTYKEAQDQLAKNQIAFEKYFKRMPEGNISARKAKELFRRCPGFVVMPQCRKGSSVSTRDNVLYQEDCDSPKAFSQWWDEKINSAKYQDVDQTIFEYLVMRFVGMTYASRPLGTCLDETDKVMLFKTEEQANILADSYPPKLWITGPAGSGKTYLLIEKAIELARSIADNGSNEKLLVLCFNSVLKLALEIAVKRHMPPEVVCSQAVHFKTFSKLVHELVPHLPLSTNQQKEKAVYQALCVLKNGSSCQAYYDHILVDEGQDLFGRHWPEVLENMHKSSVVPKVLGGFQKPGYFWVMLDMNQYLYFAKDQAQEANLAHLTNCASLSKVLRNTRNVFLQSMKYFSSSLPWQSPIRLGHGENGPAVEFDDCLHRRSGEEFEGAQSIVHRLTALQKGNVQAKDICILCENQQKRDTLRNALNINGQKTQTGDDLVKSRNDLVVVESIRRFKGLESKVVIVYNPPFVDDTSTNTRALLYTAYSRCLCLLIVMSTKPGIVALKSNEGVNTNRDPTPMDLT